MTTPTDDAGGGKPFDPKEHLSNLHKDKQTGRELQPPWHYLPVAWRLRWMREVLGCDASLETEMIAHEPDASFALFRATLTFEGRVVATGWGSETGSDFGDYIEKAETKAQGRCLGAAGFGTQFCTDDADERESVVDTPQGRGAYGNGGGGASPPQPDYGGDWRAMNLRRDGTCQLCGEPCPKGSPALWSGSEQATRHVKCHKESGGDAETAAAQAAAATAPPKGGVGCDHGNTKENGEGAIVCTDCGELVPPPIEAKAPTAS